MSKYLRFFGAAALLFSAMFLSPQCLYAEEEEPLLTIGCLSDLHTEYSMISCKDESQVRLRGSIVTALNKMKDRENVDMLLFGGDYTSQVSAPKKNWEKSRSILVDLARSVFPDGNPTPVIYATGNHEYDAAGYGNQVSAYKNYTCWDYYNIPMKTDIGLLDEDNCFYEGCKNPTSSDPNDSIFMLAAFYYQISGFDFVVLNTGKYFAENNSYYYYSQESVNWVGNKLKELYDEDPSRTVFFVVHVPFVDSNSLSNTNKGQPEDKAKDDAGVGSAVKLKRLLAEYPNTVMLYGHDHGKNSSMIKERTSQRVTRYTVEGKVMSAFDDTHFDADRKPGSDNPVPAEITSGTFYLKNFNTGKYLGWNGSNVLFNDAASKQKVKVSLVSGDTRFVTSVIYAGSDYNLDCGGEGKYNMKKQTPNDQEMGHWYKVVDVNATPVKGVKVESLVPGESYFIVHKYSGIYYALGDVVSNPTTKPRIDSKQVTFDDTVEFANPDAAKPYIYVLEPEVEQEKETEPEKETGGVFYVKNNANGKYLGRTSDGIVGFDEMSSRVTLNISSSSESKGKFKTILSAGSLNYALESASNGLYNFAIFTVENANNVGEWFCIEDIDAQTIVAGKASELEDGKSYLIVYSNGDSHFALGNQSKLNALKKKRMGSVSVSVSNDTIRMDKETLAPCIYTLEKYVEIPSFFSVYLGSCRYYDNDIDGSWIEQNYEKDPKVIQGLMIYIYSDRMEFHMKNYGDEFGNITKRDDNVTKSGVVVKEELVPYIVYRKMEKHTGREPKQVPTRLGEIPADGARSFYNIYGMPVRDDYKGIVIDGATGMKYLKE